MKTALMPALVTLGWIGLLANVPAVAQSQYDASAPVATRPVSPAAASTQVQFDSEAPMPVAQGPSGGSAGASTTMPYAATGGSPLVDNGLWTGASVGSGCAQCGGGSAPPADWYTTQGVRILSRSKPRMLDIAFQAPPKGLFVVQEADPATLTTPVDFQVTNEPTPTTATLSNGATSINNPYEVMNTKSFGLNVAPGYDMTIGHYFCRDRNNNDHFVEFSFWGLNSWSTSKSINGQLVPTYDESVRYSQSGANSINSGSLVPDTVPNEDVGSLRTPYPELSELPGATPSQQTLSLAFNNGTNYTIDYRSTMNNFEVNGRISPRGEPDRMVLHPDGRWREECQPGMYMSYLYGLRFMQLDESFMFHSMSQGFFQPDPNASTIVQYNGGGDYDIVTHNSMLGLQIGTDMTFRSCRWTWGVNAKLGPYINFASQNSSIDGQVTGPALPVVNEQLVGVHYNAALIGQVGFQATYKFRPNLVGRAGWDFMWINGVALAPEQLQFVATPNSNCNTNGSIFSQGVSLGLEWLW